MTFFKKFSLVAALFAAVACGGEASDLDEEAEFGEIEQPVNVPAGKTAIGGNPNNRVTYGGKSNVQFRLEQANLPAITTGSDGLVVPSTKTVQVGVNISSAAPEKLNALSSMQGACNQIKNLLTAAVFSPQPGGWTCTVVDRNGTGCLSADTACVTLGSAGSGTITSNSDMRKWVSVSRTSCTTQQATEFGATRDVHVCGRYNIQLNFNGIQARTDLTEPQKTTLKVFASRNGLVQGPFGIGTASGSVDFISNGRTVNSLPNPIPAPFLQPIDKCLANYYIPTLGSAASFVLPNPGC